MSDLIVYEADTIAPTLILGYTARQEASNVVHPIIGRANPDVTLRPAMLRSGTLQMLFSSPTAETESDAARQVLATAGVLSLMSSDRASIDMAFVTTGAITRELDTQTLRHWLVSFDFQEVAA